ncbi:hypothetical protein BGZ96_005627, partial [Linnemannia gamsii]
MTKITLTNPPDPPPQPASQPGQPNGNQSISSQRIRKWDSFTKMFRSSSSKPKATNSQSTSSESTVKDDSTARGHRISNAGSPESVDIDHVVSSTAVKSAPSDARPTSLLTKPRLDVFQQNVRAPTVYTTPPKFGTRIETTPQLALCIGLLSKADEIVDEQDDHFQDMSPDAAAHLIWIKAMKQDPTEHEHTLWLGTRMVEEFAKSTFKDSVTLAEMVLI